MKKPPKHLKADGRNLWRKLVAEYAIDDAEGITLLTMACEAWDRAKQAASEIELHGLLITNPSTGAVKSNPAATIERDARTSMLHALKALGLESEPKRQGPGRPPGR